jgi:hypothetical protein
MLLGPFCVGILGYLPDAGGRLLAIVAAIQPSGHSSEHGETGRIVTAIVTNEASNTNLN